MTEPTPSALAYRTVTVASIVIGLVLILLMFYFAASAVFTILGGLLVAAIFDGFSRPFRWLGLPRRGALAVVFLLVLATIGFLGYWGGATIASQAGDLLRSVQSQASDLLDTANEWGLPVKDFAPGGGETSDEDAGVDEADADRSAGSDGDVGDLDSLLPGAGGVVSTASNALFALVGWLGNVFIIIFLGAFISFQPHLYRNGLISLFPKGKRARLRDVVEDGTHALRMWLVGSALSMATVFVVSWIGLWAIGMPYAFLLSLQAGLLAFVPTLGAFVAGIPIVLTGLSQGPEMALWGLGIYVLIQGVESNVTTPIAQRWTTSLPPALTLGFQLVLGVLFGLPGLILAVPIVAVLLVVINALYVDDVLGGPFEAAEKPL